MIQPLNDWLVVERERRDVTKGGLALPSSVANSTDQYEPYKAVVIAVGPGRRLDDGEHFPMQVKVGQTVYPIGPGAEFEEDGRKFYLMQEAQIVGIDVPGKVPAAADVPDSMPEELG